MEHLRFHSSDLAWKRPFSHDPHKADVARVQTECRWNRLLISSAKEANRVNHAGEKYGSEGATAEADHVNLVALQADAYVMICTFEDELKPYGLIVSYKEAITSYHMGIECLRNARVDCLRDELSRGPAMADRLISQWQH